MSHSQRNTWINLSLWLIVATFYALDYLQHTISSVLLLPLAQSLHVGYVSIANIMNIYFPIYACTQIPAGYLIDRFGLARTLSLAAALTGLGLLIMTLPHIPLILSGRILVAVGSAFAFIGGLKTASFYLPNKLFPFMVGLLQSIGVAGGLVGQIWINHLIEQIGWRHAVLSIAIFGLAWAGIMLFSLQESTNQSPTRSNPTQSFKKKLLAIINNQSLWLLALYATLTVGAVMSTFAESYGVILLEKIKHINSEHAAWLNSLIFIGVAVGAPTHGLIATVFKKNTTWLLLCAIAICLTFSSIPLYIHTNFSVNGLSMLYFLLGFFVSSMLLSFSVAKQNVNETEQATAFAFINTMIGFGGFFVPLLFGKVIRISQHYNQGPNLIIAITTLTIPLILSIMIAFRLHQQQTINK